MADYHAVLQRTLSGFTDPKPQLRTKLYERARITIERQLTNREPPIEDVAVQAELLKLEQAIATIEQGFDPTYPDPAVETAEAENPVSQEDTVPQAPIQEPVSESAPLEEQYNPPAATVFPEVEPVEFQQSEPVLPTTEIAQEFAPEVEEIPPVEEYVETIQEAVVESSIVPEVPPVPDADAVDLWAKEFLETQTEPQPQAAIESEVSLPQVNDLLQSDPYSVAVPPQAQQPVAPTEPQPALDPVFDPVAMEPAVSDQPTIPATNFSTPGAESLVIPPAPGFGEHGSKRPKRGGFLKWLLLLIFLGLLGAAGYFGWQNKEKILETVGLSHLLGDSGDESFKPKPVKTISVKPDPEPEEPSEESQPKNEARLGANGEEILPETTQPSAPSESEVAISTPETETTNPTPSNGAPPVSQNAILYEEGATASENSVDTGRVIWSVVQESPGGEAASEPAIRGRIEIPSRNAVLIMTIKRNTDKALPASHLIELVFAVPDDFSGGSIGQISRFVLKESEQGRGEGLVGVPARIADGIFLIALNNLEEAKKKNETLLQTRTWIDIPMQYRTGRRALMTIEKGVPGEKVFKEVFEAWSKL